MGTYAAAADSNVSVSSLPSSPSVQPPSSSSPHVSPLHVSPTGSQQGASIRNDPSPTHARLSERPSPRLPQGRQGSDAPSRSRHASADAESEPVLHIQNKNNTVSRPPPLPEKQEGEPKTSPLTLSFDHDRRLPLPPSELERERERTLFTAPSERRAMGYTTGRADSLRNQVDSTLVRPPSRNSPIFNGLDPPDSPLKRPSTAESSKSEPGKSSGVGLGVPAAHSRQASMGSTGLLPEPVDKAADRRSANRRSGFYGSPNLAGPIEIRTPTSSSDPANVAASVDDESDQVSLPRTPPNPPQLPDLNRHSMTFYDPDVLLFLEAANSPEQLMDTPKAPSHSTVTPTAVQPSTSSSRVHELLPSQDAGIARSQSLARLAGTNSEAENIEHLSTIIDDEAGEENEAEESLGAGKTSALAHRVRESIRRSRDGGEAMAIDVNLVEMLLRELEETKEKMKDLQTDYTAIRVRNHSP
jgi:Rho-type GTPase-activating protein 1/2